MLAPRRRGAWLRLRNRAPDGAVRRHMWMCKSIFPPDIVGHRPTGLRRSVQRVSVPGERASDVARVQRYSVPCSEFVSIELTPKSSQIARPAEAGGMRTAEGRPSAGAGACARI